MGGTGRGRVVELVLAALVVLAALPMTGAQASGVEWVTKQIGWDGPGGGGTAVGGVGKDTLFITDEADTQRSVVINCSDWAWEEIANTKNTGGTAQIAAHIQLTASTWNGAADTLYALIEFCGPRGCAVAAGNVQTQAGFAGAHTLRLPTAGTFSDTYVQFQGVIHADADAATAIGQVPYLQPAFRIKIAGDVGGTTPKLSGCRLYLTYPKRIGSR